MEDMFHRVVRSIDAISELAPNAKAYRRLCRLLFLVCNQHALYCPMWKQIFTLRTPPSAALERLAHVLDRVKEFLQQCSHKEHWEWIAASRYDRRWEVVELLSELQECVDIINSDAIGRSEGMWAGRVLERLSDIEQEQDVDYDLHSLANEDCAELVKNASSEELVEYLSQRQSRYCPRINMEDWRAAPTEEWSDWRLGWLGQAAKLVELDYDEDLEVTKGPFLGPSSSIVQIFGWCHCHDTGKRYILTENRIFTESSDRHNHPREALTVSRLLEVTYQVAQTVLHLDRHGFQEVNIDLRLHNTVEFMVMVYWWRHQGM